MGLPLWREQSDFTVRTTAEPIDMKAFCEHASENGGESVLKTIYSHVSEIISNVYQHAHGGEKHTVEWFFSCRIVGNEFQVAVEDYGVGIFESLRYSYGSELSPEALLQPSLKKLTHRGMGLSALLRDFDSNKVSSVIFQSPAGTVSMGTAASGFHPHSIAQGTRVVFTVPLRIRSL